MMKIQFGHGGHLLDGWLNLEQHEADITKPLAFKNDSVDFILLSHVLEHVTHQQGYKFLGEAYRILKKGGVIRITVPDISKVWAEFNGQYKSLLKEGLKDWWPAIGWPCPSRDYEPTRSDAVTTLVFCHGHQSLYNGILLHTLMQASGFITTDVKYGKSHYPELNDTDRHHIYRGLENCILESAIVEGEKP